MINLKELSDELTGLKIRQKITRIDYADWKVKFNNFRPKIENIGKDKKQIFKEVSRNQIFNGK